MPVWQVSPVFLPSGRTTAILWSQLADPVALEVDFQR